MRTLLTAARRAEIDAMTRQELEVAWVRAMARMRRSTQACLDWDENPIPSSLISASMLVSGAQEAEADWDYIDDRLTGLIALAEVTWGEWGPRAE